MASAKECLSAMKSLRFGVEVEFSYITRDEARDVIRGALSDQDMVDGKGRKWKIVRDGSVVPRRLSRDGSDVSADDSYRVELNTPILEYEDMDLLLEVITALRKAGAAPSDVCGIHVHVGEKGSTARSLRNVLNLFSQKESIMLEAFKIDGGRLDRYCRFVSEPLIEQLRKQKPGTEEQLRKQWDSHCGDRYRMCNLSSYFNGKGIEFRLFNSTLNVSVVRAYVVFCLAITQKSKAMQRAVSIKSEMQNNRYEWRNFLNRLGLAGDEFKAVRKELLKNVSGDSAFSKPEEHNRKRILSNV